MIDGYINIARKLSREFDIVLAKELFSSLIVKGIEVHLIVSLGGDETKTIPNYQNKYHVFKSQIIHKFKKRELETNLYLL